MFSNASILITGATGSLGHQLVRTLLMRERPRRVIVFSRDEYKQALMRERFMPLVKALQAQTESPDYDPMRYFIGDVRDYARLLKAMDDVDYVIHAAALKQVDTCEYNSRECLKTNIHGALNVIDACLEKNVKKVVALSSDKAADPQNFYGASKLTSDMLFTTIHNETGSKNTRFSVVRYGNVLGSRGSVIPFFKALIQAQSQTPCADFALPITDFHMTRFWITRQQGVDFVLKAHARMRGGEIFIPKIPSMRVADLASSLFPNYPQKEIGLRPGEKLHEVMIPASFSDRTLAFADHFVIRPSTNLDVPVDYFQNALGETAQAVPRGFEYNSQDNPDFLTSQQICQLVDLDGIEG